MSERLTDEEFTDVVVRVQNGRCAVCDDGPNRHRCFQCQGTGAFSLSTRAMQSILDELIERRAADLTAEEREALVFARERLNYALNPVSDDGCPCSACEKHRAAITTLDKLTRSGK